MPQQPARRRSASRAAEESTAPPRHRLRGRDQDDEEEKEERPAARRSASRAGAQPLAGSGGRGWASHRKNQAKTRRGFGNNPDEFQVSDEDTVYLVKMLEDEPFWSYLEHFVSEIEDGKRSFTCGGDECPLCAWGDTPRSFTLFNVAAWDPAGDGQWTRKFWRASPDPAGKIEARAEELAGRKNPQALGDDDIYLAVSKSKSGKRKGGRAFNEYRIDIVKERDLADYDADPLTDSEYDDFTETPFDENVVPEPSLRDLRIAAEALDD